MTERLAALDTYDKWMVGGAPRAVTDLELALAAELRRALARHICTRWEYSDWGCRRTCKHCGRTQVRPSRHSDQWKDQG